MCVYIAIIATILQEMLWEVDKAPALKGNGSELESWLAGHLEKGCVHWRGARYINVWGSALWEEVQTGDAIFF